MSRSRMTAPASPWLTFDAIDFLASYLRPGMRVFEYGSGGSTLFWLEAGTVCVSVEHDRRWFEEIAARATGYPSFEYYLVTPEISGTLDSDPADPNAYVSGSPDFRGLRFQRYASEIEKFPDEWFDVVLIDGRARPSCIKHSFRKVRIGGLLVIDDADRDYYFARTSSYLDGFDKTAFRGLVPASEQLWTTAIYTRRERRGP